MNAQRLTPRALAALATVATLATSAVVAGCGRPPAPAAGADATYTVRAEIVRLPAAPGGEIYLRHEAIPDFRDSRGETVGMASMTMPFGAAAGLDLAGVAAGDRAEVTFEVRWSGGESPLRVTRVVPLPPGTALGFDAPAAPPSPDGQPAGETPR